MKTFSARETVWLQELDGIELAGFRRRAFAFTIDWAIISVILTLVLGLGGLALVGIDHLLGRQPTPIDLTSSTSHITISSGPSPHIEKGIHYHAGLPPDEADAKHGHSRLLDEATHIVEKILVPVLYFGLFFWRWNGQTPGKRWMKIRVISLVHPHMTFWHSIERALGYGAAALEGGFGFIQYWIHPYRRCAQDRLAETIVVTERSYVATFRTPPTAPDEPTAF